MNVAPVRHPAPGAGDARAADPARPGPAVRAPGDLGRRGGAVPGRARRHRGPPVGRPARRGPARRRVPALADRSGRGSAGGRAAASVLDAADRLPEHPVAVRPVLRGDHPAQRDRERRHAVRAGRRGRRGAAPAGRTGSRAAGGVRVAPRPGRGDPPGAYPAARRWGEPGGDHPDPARADGRFRRRVLPGPRGRPSGGRAAGSGGVAAHRRAAAHAPAAGSGRRGGGGTPGCPRSLPTTGRWAGSGSGPRWA